MLDDKKKPSKQLRLTDYKVPHTKWTLLELCALVMSVDSKMTGAEWEANQASNDHGDIKMSLQERFAYISALDSPRLERLFWVGTKTYDNQECAVAYTGAIRDNAIGMCFLRNNMSKLARGCRRAMRDLTDAWDIVSELAILLGDDMPEEVRAKIASRVTLAAKLQKAGEN